MKALLIAIQTALKGGLSYVRDDDIFITPHENYIPHAVRPTCVGLKDGPIKRIELAGGMMEYIMDVQVVLWVDLLKEEASIIGDAAAGEKGVLEVGDDVHVLLDENLLGITGMIAAYSPAETGSELFGDDSKTMQRKIITYRYTKQEVRP
jgi:hypothetical protein